MTDFAAVLFFQLKMFLVEIVAFGGRIMEKGEPKYLNSPESPVYIRERIYMV